MLVPVDKVVNGAVVKWFGRVLLVGRRSGKFVLCLDSDNLPVILLESDLVHVEHNLFFGNVGDGDVGCQAVR